MDPCSLALSEKESQEVPQKYTRIIQVCVLLKFICIQDPSQRKRCSRQARSLSGTSLVP